MNKQNVKKLRDFIAGLPEKAVHMPSYILLDQSGETIEQAAQHVCGTKACIAGWAVLALYPERATVLDDQYDPSINDEGIDTVAQRLLELDWRDADFLFLGEWAGSELNDITKADVIRQLDYMLETGHV